MPPGYSTYSLFGVCRRLQYPVAVAARICFRKTTRYLYASKYYSNKEGRLEFPGTKKIWSRSPAATVVWNTLFLELEIQLEPVLLFHMKCPVLSALVSWYLLYVQHVSANKKRLTRARLDTLFCVMNREQTWILDSLVPGKI